jgi:hypothetical protein
MTAVSVAAVALAAAALLIRHAWRRLDRATKPGVWDAETDERTQLAPEDEDAAALDRHLHAARRTGLQRQWGEGVTNDPETS